MTVAPARLSPIDLRLRLVALALEPGLTLARLSALPLDDLQALVGTGYFRQWRARGLSLRGIARVLHKSLRTVATLSGKASDEGALLDAGERITLRRKLAARVAERGPTERTVLATSIRGARRADRQLRDQQYAALRDAVVAADSRPGDDRREASIAYCIGEAPRGFPWSVRNDASGQDSKA